MSLIDSDEYTGWQGEVAIALESLGNNFEDGAPAWAIASDHGRIIGFSMQLNDDDDGAETREHKMTWAQAEEVETAWKNPGAFGKMIFFDPSQDLPPLLEPVLDLACTRLEDNSVELTWRNPPSASDDVETKIFVDGGEVISVPGAAELVVLTPDLVPSNGADHTIEVINNSEQVASCLLQESGFDACGGIREWNILGAYLQDGGCCPEFDTIRLDYMTDGDLTELTFDWEEGAVVETDYELAASTDSTGGDANRNPEGFPTVFVRKEPGGRVGLNIEYGGPALENTMAYAQTYITVEEPTEVWLGVASDDSIQILVNGVEVFINSVGRGGAECGTQDFLPDPILLEEGTNSLMVKVFNGVQGWDFTVRFQDGPGLFASPIVDGIRVSATRPGGGPPGGPRFRRGDPDNSGGANISDAVGLLNFLFAGGDAPLCTDAADVDDDGNVNISDAVNLLNFLFSGGAAPAPPGSIECGVDPADSPANLGCETYTTC